MNKSGKSLSAVYWEGRHLCAGFAAPAWSPCMTPEGNTDLEHNQEADVLQWQEHQV